VASQEQVSPRQGGAQQSILKNISWSVLGQVFYALGQWATVLVLARIGGPSWLGQYTIAVAVTAPVTILFRLELRNFQAVDSLKSTGLEDCLVLRAATGVLALTFIAGIAWICGFPFAIIMALALLRFAEGFTDVCYGPMLRNELHDSFGKSLVLHSVTVFCTIFCLLLAFHNLVIGFLGAVLIEGVVFFAYDWKIASRLRDDALISVSNLSGIFWRSLPFGLATAIFTLNVNVPRYVIENLLSITALGLFGCLMYFIFVGNTIMTGLCNAATPRLAHLHASNQIGRFVKLQLGLVMAGIALGGLGCLATVLFGARLINTFFGATFAEVTPLLPAIMAVAAVHYAAVPIVSGISAMQQYRCLPLLHGSTLILNVMASVFCIGRFGFSGVVIALLISGVYQFCVAFLIERKYLMVGYYSRPLQME
jgi:O-antigen/teichoic acid export membrane protein